MCNSPCRQLFQILRALVWLCLIHSVLFQFQVLSKIPATQITISVLSYLWDALKVKCQGKAKWKRRFTLTGSPYAKRMFYFLFLRNICLNFRARICFVPGQILCMATEANSSNKWAYCWERREGQETVGCQDTRHLPHVGVMSPQRLQSPVEPHWGEMIRVK